MKKNDVKNYLEDDETEEWDLEDLTEIQGGIDDDGTNVIKSCGLGCILGAGSGGLDFP